VEARHRRRVHQAQHQAAKQVVALALQQRVGTLLVGDPTGITKHDAGRVQDWRLRQWRRTHLLQALHDKAEQAGIDARRRSCLASATHPTIRCGMGVAVRPRPGARRGSSTPLHERACLEGH
jgi:IS605 OrfB family transposase